MITHFCFCTSLTWDNRRFTRCKGPAPTRGGVRRHLPEIQIFFQPAGVYWLRSHLCFVSMLHGVLNSCFFFSFAGPSEINYLQPFIRGAGSSCIQTFGHGECPNLSVSPSNACGDNTCCCYCCKHKVLSFMAALTEESGWDMTSVLKISPPSTCLMVTHHLI